MSIDPGRAALDAEVDRVCRERKVKFVRGFVRFVISQGYGAKCPSIKDDKGAPITWQQRGRQMYGKDLFDTVMREELAARKRAEEAASNARR